MINNSSSEILLLNPRETLGILDLGSLGYYKIKQGVIQQKLTRYYELESADKVYMQFNNSIIHYERKKKFKYRRKISMVGQFR